VPIGRRGHARVGVLTVIEEEFDATRQLFDANHEVGATSVFAPVSTAGVDKPSLPFVVARCANRSNVPAHSAAAQLIERWRPEVVLLLGVAGGINRPIMGENGITWQGPLPGDIVVAEYVHYAEFTKNVASGSKLRYFPVDPPTSALVQAHADALRRPPPGVEPWHIGTEGARPAAGIPLVHVGEIIAVEGVAGDPSGAHQMAYLQQFDHALAIDMESGGVGRALHDARDDTHYNPQWMCIRAVSDRVFAPTCADEVAAIPPHDNQAERDRWKAYAATTVARFGRHVVERLLSQPRQAFPGDDGAPAFGPWTSE
jgi:nucleoside phosphorylase